MTVEEYNHYGSQLDWGKWLQGILLQALEGTGLRPEVEYVPEVWRDPNEKELEKDPEAKPVLEKPEMFRLTITRPLDWRVINLLAGDDICADRALEIARMVSEFNTGAWPDRMVTDWQYDLFRKIPGFFDWLSEETPLILHRITMRRLCEEIGKRNIKDIDLYEDIMVIHTRRGNWRIDYDNFRDRLEEVLKLMRPWMRIPIRYKYLYNLRHNNGKDNEKKG